MWAFSISLLFTFASKVRPLRTPTLWSQRSRWTTPWRWPAWSLACSCSPSSSWAWCSPSRGGECGLLPCRLCQPQVAPTPPYGQVLSLLTTSRQGPPGWGPEIWGSCGSSCCSPKGVCWLRGEQLQDGQCLAGQVFLGVPMLLRDSCSVVIGHIIRITGELQGHRWDRHRKAVFHSAHLHPSPICLWSRNSVPLHQRVEALMVWEPSGKPPSCSLSHKTCPAGWVVLVTSQPDILKAQLSRIVHIAHESQDPGSLLIPQIHFMLTSCVYQAFTRFEDHPGSCREKREICIREGGWVSALTVPGVRSYLVLLNRGSSHLHTLATVSPCLLPISVSMPGFQSWSPPSHSPICQSKQNTYLHYKDMCCNLPCPQFKELCLYSSTNYLTPQPETLGSRQAQ